MDNKFQVNDLFVSEQICATAQKQWDDDQLRIQKGWNQRQSIPFYGGTTAKGEKLRIQKTRLYPEGYKDWCKLDKMNFQISRKEAKKENTK